MKIQEIENEQRFITLDRSYFPALNEPSVRCADIAFQFGVPMEAEPVRVLNDLVIPIWRGGLVLLLGPSGCGKSTALAEIAKQRAGGCFVDRVSFPKRRAIIDRVRAQGSLADALALMSYCGLAQPHLWLRSIDNLSVGEQFRARLARAVGLHVERPGDAPLLCDEFCSTLHRRAARAISFNLRKIITKERLIAVVASNTGDILADLNPDVVVRMRGPGDATVERRHPRRRSSLSMIKRLHVEPGKKTDYESFASLHYKSTGELGFVDKIFLLREGERGEPLGIVVYSHPPLELSFRNRITNKRFQKSPKLLNRSVRILRRLVIHPDVRGCGLGHYLVRKTLPIVGTEYVECLASMGAVNPVFEKAGMERIGQYEIAPNRKAAVEQLKNMGVDPASSDFVGEVTRKRDVRRIVAGVVYDWYQATTAGGKHRVGRQSPEFLARIFRGLIGSQPVYYLWHRSKIAGVTRRKVA